MFLKEDPKKLNDRPYIVHKEKGGDWTGQF